MNKNISISVRADHLGRNDGLNVSQRYAKAMDLLLHIEDDQTIQSTLKVVNAIHPWLRGDERNLLTWLCANWMVTHSGGSRTQRVDAVLALVTLICKALGIDESEVQRAIAYANSRNVGSDIETSK